MKFKLSLSILILVYNLTWSQEQFSVYFESNKFELVASESKSLQDWISENTMSKIIGVYGFCDEDGSAKFNDTLASKRIDFVFQKVKNKLKIREDFKARSFGELHQQSPIKAKNRKVTLFFLKEKDISREAEILGLKPKEIATVKPTISFPDKIIIQNPNGTKSEYALSVKFMQSLNEAKVGEKMQLDNLNFVLNTYAVVNESRGKLYELLLVMQNNPNIKININGHLCCIAVDKKDLSTQRAKAVYKFLEINNIDKSRMSYKGFGSTIPLFTLPEKTEMERAANRRVEIEIVEN
ncbi:OmpA family protein [Flavobacterium sp.]|uniref:OmpA family protein n=1 Tax=Flavobacterium sp. TaxID=239 RepID=UPI0037530081